MPRPSTAARLPVADFERLDAETAHLEDVMLRVRLRAGLPTALLSDAERDRAAQAVDRRTAAAARATGWCSPTAAGCWPTRWCARCWGD